MCYAVLRVSYQDTMEQPTFHPVELEAELLDKIAEIQQRPKVRKVQWFILTGSRERVESWQQTNHNQSKDNEEKYEVYVPPSFTERPQDAP